MLVVNGKVDRLTVAVDNLTVAVDNLTVAVDNLTGRVEATLDTVVAAVMGRKPSAVERS